MPVICYHTWFFKQVLLPAKQFKARKGLDAYNQFICGWAKEVTTRKITEKYVVSGWVSVELSK